MSITVLAFNLGATSTKIAVYCDNKELFNETLNHPKQEINQFNSSKEQKEYRKNLIIKAIEQHNIPLETISTVVTRGGVLSPINAGAYEINQVMMDYQMNFDNWDHITLIGTTLANELAKEVGSDAKAYIYDGESMDQFNDISRITGTKYIQKSSLGHSLNIRAVVRKTAEELNIDLNDSKFVVAHIGSGNTIAAVDNNRIIDMIVDDEGPFSSERAGGQSVKEVINICYQKPKEEVLRMFRQEGGLYSYLDTNDGREVEKRIKNGDEYAELIYDAMAYQIAKACAEMSIPLLGNIDQIIITGGLSYSTMLVDMVNKWVGNIGPMTVLPGEYEMEALAKGAYRVTIGEEEVQTFTVKES